jgi:hypothetical protein
MIRIEIVARVLPVIAVAVLLTRAAPAQTPDPPKAATAEDRREVNLVRVGLGGAYFRGSRLIGSGTRKPYQGVDGNLYLDVLRFPLRWFGFEIDLEGGGANAAGIPMTIGLRLAADFVPLRWSGTAPGSIILGVGGGLDAGDDRTWIDDTARAYPLLLARLRVFPSRAIGLSAAWHFVPITTSLLLEEKIVLYTNQIEAAMSYGYLQFGARTYLSTAIGGDPRRTYNEARFGPFVGAVFY